MTETTPDKVARQTIEKRERIQKSGGIFDKDLKRWVPMPKDDKGSRFYATPAGIGSPKKGR